MWARALALAAAVAGCGQSPRAPAPAAMSPDRGAPGAAVPVTIRGEHFYLTVQADYGSGRSRVNASFRLTLGGVPLEEVTYVDSRTLRAVVPAGLALGAHELVVTDPAGRQGRLAAAFTVTDAVSGDGGPDADRDGGDVDAGDGGGDADALDGGGGDADAPDGGRGVVARLVVAPAAGEAGETFVLDASGSMGRGLRYRFDLDGDGTFDTEPGPKARMARRYEEPGVYRVAVAVEDDRGGRDYAEAVVVVAAAGELLRVTTGVDESTSPPEDGEGLSLREALDVARQRPGRQVITFAPGITTTLARALPDADDVDIVGSPDTIVDGGGGGCWLVSGDGVHIYGLELRNCGGPCLQVDGRAAEFSIEGSRLHGCQRGAMVFAERARLGPDLEVFDNRDEGLFVAADGVRIDRARVHGNRIGIFFNMAGDRSILRRSRVYGNREDGIFVTVNVFGNAIEHCTVDGNGAHGLRVSSNAAGLRVQNSLFTFNGGAGIAAASEASFAVNGPNGHYGNAQEGRPGKDAVLEDPRYADRAAADYTLLPGSPAIDAATRLGYDINGPAPGLFNGPEPDLGALESP